jgi:hypothetical protein
MKRIVQLLTAVVLVALTTTTAKSFNITAGLTAILSEALDVARAHAIAAPPIYSVDFAISKVDKQTIQAFHKAWQRSGNGSSPFEGVVLILKMGNGTYQARELGATNEHKKFTFAWHPATIAIVHTHPNNSDPKPQDDDITVADKHHVPIFTITSRGMFVYDPSTKKTSQLMSNLDWLELSKFNKSLVAKK